MLNYIVKLKTEAWPLLSIPLLRGWFEEPGEVGEESGL